MGTMFWVWIGVIVISVVFEFSSPIQLAGIWSALGAVAALVLELFGAEIWVQVVVFILVTIVLIALTRPFARKMTNFKKSATNADINIGKKGTVTRITDEDAGIFRVKVDNEDWSATTEDNKPLPVGSAVSVLRIEGVKLVVEPVGQGN